VQDYIINEFLSVKSEGSTWDIYISNLKVEKRRYTIYNISPKEIIESEEIPSADWYFSDGTIVEAEFTNVCEILEIWYKNRYDTSLLNKEGAFPLLRLLYIAGDPVANEVFLSEIEKRIKTNHPPTMAYLVEFGFIDYLNIPVMNELTSMKDVGKELLRAMGLTKFLVRFYSALESDDLWDDFPDLLMEPLKIEREFSKTMKLEHSEEGLLIMPLLFMHCSEEKIDTLCKLTEQEILEILHDILSQMAQNQMIIKKEFEVNQYITLKLIGNTTYIYVNNEKFLHCKYLLMNLEKNKIKEYKQFQSIDEASMHLDRSLERGHLSIFHQKQSSRQW